MLRLPRSPVAIDCFNLFIYTISTFSMHVCGGAIPVPGNFPVPVFKHVGQQNESPRVYFITQRHAVLFANKRANV